MRYPVLFADLRFNLLTSCAMSAAARAGENTLRAVTVSDGNSVEVATTPFFMSLSSARLYAKGSVGANNLGAIVINNTPKMIAETA